MSSARVVHLSIGDVINDRYTVLECLGIGSVAVVYKCEDRALPGLIVAIKVLFPRFAADSHFVARFRQEIVSSYIVNHRNVVRTFDYIHNGDLVALTMEYVSGGDLLGYVSGDTLLSLDEIVNKSSQMCAGIQAIHDAGIVHRDIKPENVLLTEEGIIKIADFGIAWKDSAHKLTNHGNLLGTVNYVSPEYLEIGQFDKRSDIYALGVLTYELITGRSPFRSANPIESMAKRVKMDPEPPHMYRRECPPELTAIVLRAMQRDPEQRYQNAAEMYHDLRLFRASAVPFDSATNMVVLRLKEEGVVPMDHDLPSGDTLQYDSPPCRGCGEDTEDFEEDTVTEEREEECAQDVVTEETEESEEEPHLFPSIYDSSNTRLTAQLSFDHARALVKRSPFSLRGPKRGLVAGSAMFLASLLAFAWAIAGNQGTDFLRNAYAYLPFQNSEESTTDKALASANVEETSATASAGTLTHDENIQLASNASDNSLIVTEPSIARKEVYGSADQPNALEEAKTLSKEEILSAENADEKAENTDELVSEQPVPVAAQEAQAAEAVAEEKTAAKAEHADRAVEESAENAKDKTEESKQLVVATNEPTPASSPLEAKAQAAAQTKTPSEEAAKAAETATAPKIPEKTPTKLESETEILERNLIASSPKRITEIAETPRSIARVSVHEPVEQVKTTALASRDKDLAAAAALDRQPIKLARLGHASETTGATPEKLDAPAPVSDPGIEYKVKATLLYKLADFVTWPKNSKLGNASTVKVCLGGRDPFGSYIDSLNEKIASRGSKKRSFVRMSADAPVSALAGCDIAFLSKSAAKRLSSAESALLSANTLTVTENEGGGIVDFFLDNGKVRFRLDQSKARKAGLAVSERLQRLAAAPARAVETTARTMSEESKSTADNLAKAESEKSSKSADSAARPVVEQQKRVELAAKSSEKGQKDTAPASSAKASEQAANVATATKADSAQQSLLASLAPSAVAVPEARPTPTFEYRVKAALISKFAELVTWPTSSESSNVKICLMGKSHLASYLEELNRTSAAAGNRKRQIVHLPSNAVLSSLAGCDIAFLSGELADLLKRFESRLFAAHVLTITENGGGGIIDLFLKDGKIRYSVDGAKTRRAGLRIDSRLSRLSYGG